MMKTALVTGATEGIGFEFSKLFAQNGINLILVARNEAKLRLMAGELAEKCSVNVRFYAKDLSELANAELIYAELESAGIAVDFVVNNAGFGVQGEFTETDWARELQMYNLNMLTLAYFTKVFAHDMRKRGGGRILNVASTGSFQPGPYMAGYCASKAFVLSLSEAVSEELRGSNVSVTALCPGVTDTKFHSTAKTEQTGMSKYLSHASPERVASYGYRIMMKGKPSGIYGLVNRVIVFSNRLVCRRLATVISGKLLKG